MTRHSMEVARFTNGETRLVYARHRDAPPGAPLYYLPDNTVTRELRVYARQHLMCVVPDSALDTHEVIARVDALGGPTYSGTSTGNTARRDLTVREAGNHPGHPRVLSIHVRGRCLFYPSNLTQAVAVARYLARGTTTA